jgi:hypothetical protein
MLGWVSPAPTDACAPEAGWSRAEVSMWGVTQASGSILCPSNPETLQSHLSSVKATAIASCPDKDTTENPF